MKAKNVLDKLKDLKLRRWGPAEYTEAKNSNGGGSDSSSKEITIDDVVKFIHDNTEHSMVDIPTKYNDIKHVSEPLYKGFNLVKGTSEEILNFIENNTDPHIQHEHSILESTNYAIAVIFKDQNNK